MRNSNLEIRTADSNKELYFTKETFAKKKV